MKVAILSHFQGFAPGYALAVGWYERARVLEYYGKSFGIEFDFFTAKNCPEGCYPNQKAVLATVPGSKPFDYKVDIFTKQYLELLGSYDVVLTADIIYQRKGNFLAWNQAMRNASKHLKAWWCHWIHSSWTNRPSMLNLKDPDHLRYTMMDRSFLVYLNSYEIKQVATMYDTPEKNVRVVYNNKDPRVFFDFHPHSWTIVKQLSLFDKDVISVFPHCSTRMDAKGFDGVIAVIAALKRRGLKVGLVFCNANARKVQPEIMQKKQLMLKMGLHEGEDYMFTHDLDNWKPMPRKVIRDLMRISNIFTFASWRETTGNIFQEAQISGNLLVLNGNLPCLRELATKIPGKVVWLNTSYKTPGVRDGTTGDLQQVDYHPTPEEYFDHLIEHEIMPKLEDKHYQWDFSFERIWMTQFWPLLREAEELSNTTRIKSPQPPLEGMGDFSGTMPPPPYPPVRKGTV